MKRIVCKHIQMFFVALHSHTRCDNSYRVAGLAAGWVNRYGNAGKFRCSQHVVIYLFALPQRAWIVIYVLGKNFLAVCQG